MSSNSSRWQTLSIPVNPKFDWNANPNDQASFFNPVTLCNKEVQYANDIIQITGELIEHNKLRGSLKLDQSKLQTRKKDLESEIIVRYPPSANESKNLMVLAAYIKDKIEQSDLSEEYASVQQRLAKIEESLSVAEIKAENARLALEALKLVCQNIQTALSYYKAEMKVVR